MIEVRVPDEQEGTKAVVRAWLRQVGDAVAENDPLVELETDKVTQEVPAPAAGVLVEIVLQTDAEALPGALLARIDAHGAAAAPSAPAKAQAEERKFEVVPAQEHGHLHAHSAPTTQQIRTIGQRRREAEEKLEHHLEEARHKTGHDHHPVTHPAPTGGGAPDVEGGDVAAIQNDDRLTAADRVDMIANQVVSEPDGNDAR